jgi:hypothetical protein
MNVQAVYASMIRFSLIALVMGATPSALAQPQAWQQTIELRDAMQVCDFPEQIVSWPIAAPPGAVRPEQLKLVEQGTSTPLPYQLTDVVLNEGYLATGTLHFRAGLKQGQSRVFLLTADPAYKPHFAGEVTVESGKDGFIVRNQHVAVLMPTSGRGDERAAPIKAIGTHPDRWAATGAFTGAQPARVEAKVIEQGPLLVVYRIKYTFTGGRTYSVDLTLRSHERHVLISEQFDGFTREDKPAVGFELSFKEGVNPDRQYAAGDAAGEYGKQLKIVRLGFPGSSLETAATGLAFYRENDRSGHAITFVPARLSDWKPSLKPNWMRNKDYPVLDALEFDADAMRMHCRLVGGERHWAVGVTPRSEVKADTHTQLYRLLNHLNLDINRAVSADFEEDLNARITDWRGDPWFRNTDVTTAAPFDKLGAEIIKYGKELAATDNFGLSDRDLGPHVVSYINSRAGWTEQQRRQVRAMLVYRLQRLMGETWIPHRASHSWSPNMFNTHKSKMTLALRAFPQHPSARAWRDEAIYYFTDFLDQHTRKDLPDLHAVGGRSSECPTCYMIVSLNGLMNMAGDIGAYDGTKLLVGNPNIDNAYRYVMDLSAPFLSSGIDGKNYMPGAAGQHAKFERWDENPDNQYEDMRGFMLHAADLLARQGNPIGEQVAWVFTHGATKEKQRGSKPQIVSRIYSDGGFMLRHDHGGPNEAYVYVYGSGNLTGIDEYQPGDAYPYLGGTIYYGAKGSMWSWNGGLVHVPKGYDRRRLPYYHIDGVGLGYATKPDAYGVLYDFGFAQYYRLGAGREGTKAGYRSRAVMMVRDECIAVYDDVASDDTAGRFQWINERNGLLYQYFTDTDFRQELGTQLITRDEPLETTFRPGDRVPGYPGLNRDRFSVRIRSNITAQVGATHDYKWNIRIGKNDTLKLWIDGKLLADLKGKDGSASMRLEDGRHYDFRIDYTHDGGEPKLEFAWADYVPRREAKLGVHNDPTRFPIERFFLHEPLPQITTIRGAVNEDSKGDQFHVIAPAGQTLPIRAVGGLVVLGQQEPAFLLDSDKAAEHSQGPLKFSGRTAYAAPSQLALFEGSRLRYGDLELSVDGDFGASIELRDGTLGGRIAGRKGGRLAIAARASVSSGNLAATVEYSAPGRAKSVVVPVTRLSDGSISFPVDVAQSDGVIRYRIAPAERP